MQYYFIFEPSILFFRADIGIPYGTFAQKNVFATYLAFGSLLSIYFLFTTRTHSKLLLAMTIITVIANAHLTMLVDGKTGRVVPLIAIFLFTCYFAWKKQKLLIPTTLVLVTLIFSFMPRQWFDIRPSQVGEAPLGIKSFGVRPTMYKLGAELVLEKPFQGHGMGTLPYLFEMKKTSLDQSSSRFAGGESIVDHIHNEPLQWMIEMGVLSGVAFVSLFLVWCAGLYKGWLEPSVLLLALPFVGHSMLEYPFYHSAPHLLAFAIIMGLAIRHDRKTKILRFSPVVLGVVVPLVCFLAYQSFTFFARSLASSDALVKYRMGNEQDINILYSVEPTYTFEPFFTHEKFEWRLKEGMQKGTISQKDVFDFIDFLEKRRKEMPESLLFIQLAELYTIAGQTEKAQKVMEEARLFFPWNVKVKAYFAVQDGKS
jgi:O-antigen polymerase